MCFEECAKWTVFYWRNYPNRGNFDLFFQGKKLIQFNDLN